MTRKGGEESRIDRKFSKTHGTLSISILALILLASVQTVTAATSVHGDQYPSGPWGLGVVVPENSRFTDGSRLSWANVSSVYVELTLPNITFCDSPVLVVESLMAADGSVMQIAAGIYPGNSKWLAYGWFIRNVEAYQQSYNWVLNSSKPEMQAGEQVSLSIFLSQGRWRYRLEDMSTNEVTTGEYAATVPPTLKVGDQEVFALESYTTSTLVFAHMGNLTLNLLRINGRKIATGWYYYGSWDTQHNPLFVVGGLDPPSYMSLQATSRGSLVWGYEQWATNEQTQPQSLPMTTVFSVIVLVGIVTVTAVYMLMRRTRRSTGPASNQSVRL